MIRAQTETLRCLLVAFVVLLAILAAALFAQRDRNCLLSEGVVAEGVPMVTNNDGYYHMTQARLLAEQGGSLGDFTNSLYKSLLLPAFLAVLGGTDTADLLSVSVWIGPVLGLTILLAVLPWAWRTRSALVLLTAPILAYLAPAWMDRTHYGSLDTDSLVPCTVYFALFCMERFSVSDRRRVWWLAGWMVMTAWLWLWWKPGAFLCLCMLPLNLAYLPRFKDWLPIKVILIALVFLAVALGVGGITPFSSVWTYLHDHLRLAFGLGGDTLTHKAILELSGLTLVELGDKVLGAWWLLPVSIVGGVMFGRNRGWEAFFLIFFWIGSGVAALLSNRFTVLFIPSAAFFATYGLVCVEEMVLSSLMRRGDRLIGWAHGFAAALAVVVLIGPSVQKARDFKPESYFSGHDYLLGKEIRASFSPETVIWTWWDFGYFYKFFTGMRPLFDGGSQTDRSCFVAAYPLMQESPRLAAAWMHHFAANSVRSLPFGNRGADWERIMSGLVGRLAEADADKGVPVALCLPDRVYTTVGYLYAFAHIFDGAVPPVVNRLDLFTKEGFRDDPLTNQLFVPQAVMDKGYTEFGAVINATGKVPEQIDFGSLVDPYLVHSDNADFLAVTDRPVVQSVLFRLLGLFRQDEAVFQTVSFNWRHGGLWHVR